MSSRKNTIKMTLQKQLTTATPDAAGHIDTSQAAKWEDITERFFHVMPQSGREFYRAQKTEANITHLLETYHDDQTKLIDPKYRLRITGTDRYLNIVSSMNVDEMNRKVRISCIEAV